MEREQKTKLGIPVVVMSAALFFSGMESNLIAIGLILYVLVFEESVFVRNCAKKMFVWMIIFTMLNSVYSILGLLIAEINSLTGSKLQITTEIQTIIILFEELLFFILGIQALRGKEVKLYFIDRMAGLLNEEDWLKIKQELKNKAEKENKVKKQENNSINNKADTKEESKTIDTMPIIGKRAVKYCDKCGQELEGNAQFCIYCGVKQDSN